MEVIQFPPAKGLLDFDGMGIEINIEKQRESWATNLERWRREQSSGTASPAKDAMADLIFSLLLDRENELVAEAEAGLAVQDQLDVVRALLRLIFSPNVRMPLTRLQ
jgi:hypothetical protein